MLHATVTTTAYHAKLFAHDLTRRSADDGTDRLSSALSDAQVDLNPHQIEAALFALRNPFSKGVILADEVGLGKTIEAGLLLSQLWAERRRKLLIILPANLRKQWSQELADKFHLPSIILEAKSFNEAIRGRNLNPFVQPQIVLCSFQFARTKDTYIQQVAWDLVVIDEAHRLRNVYRGSNKIATAIKQAVAPYTKVLLTATPLQNSLLELYGLVSIIDEYAFGDLKSFKAKYSRLSSEEDFSELRERLKPLCKRTLRKQVLEYVKYTSRHALVQEFFPTDDEQRLYDEVSEYLQQPILYALPSGQRQLMTLVLRKLLASSSYAIAHTLDGLVKKLEKALAEAALVDAPPEDLGENWEDLDELTDEWDGEDDPEDLVKSLTPAEIEGMQAEVLQLRDFHTLARSIIQNSKGENLLTALRRGFSAAVDAQKRQGAATLQQKAVIFTESRRTQEYLLELLADTEFAGKAILFNGTNNDPQSKAIYRRWMERHAGTDRISGSPTADMRAALVDCFRDEASILIATEAAAEGINLQFCNLVVNYDLPWNPQRIEQRIGRCHRYGQKFDVVVVNFLNKRNAADVRVYQLLDEKFRLFNGVFGASDEVLGVVESGVDFEKRIANIYQKCRSPGQISFEFDALQSEMESEIAGGQQDAREKLLNNFDIEVIEKVKVQSAQTLDTFNARLWSVTRFMLDGYATFDEAGHDFRLESRKTAWNDCPLGNYRMAVSKSDSADMAGQHTYRLGHPLAQRLLAEAQGLQLPVSEIAFHFPSSGTHIAILEPLVGQSGWLACSRYRMDAIESEDHLVFAGMTDDGQVISTDQCRRLFDLDGVVAEGLPLVVGQSVEDELNDQLATRWQALAEDIGKRDGSWFDVEMDKLDRWADDRRVSLKAELDDLEQKIREKRRVARQAANIPDKLERQRELRKLESQRDDAWRTYDQASRDVERKKDDLLDDMGNRMKQRTDEERLFVVRWRVA
ncbi:SNF2-related protein [Acidithiobacillus ferriphilus]|uniref:SNF2-related protein n=1 Tax=Acidithiobacillus ferriphilus TaxID=1689834 RepID=A0ABU6FQN5_9PROT|nr:SNF2-related protein [Acidithiobacillus ferriphilus]MEB8486349.1 SNF2-related protein [Acidithiobacillus ferriphilus]MEB8490065.1 SNF2-related protein [Acidithiobacillus ferriphilus]MEB8493815.1 SNF2-related protein [Acidithiobacillus ferriphilus]MEB8513160.1 SNF2-related protein [Acidithiobacillus ferriphilus]MEB8558609.1 SNF2-related protein [Acidithiobacillus ferriphilus]